MKLTYQITGMHCAACIEKIKSSLSTHVKITRITLNPPQLEIEENNPPKLSELNKLIAKAGNYSLTSSSEPKTKTTDTNPSGLKAYYPIFLIAAYIAVVTTINNLHWPDFNWHGWMSQFMAGFFLIFSAFKFLDLRGFAEGYASYDLLAKRLPAYGYLYPFLELTLGLLYLTQWIPVTTQVATLLIMGFSSLGVINSLLKKEKFQCACLGTLLKVPLSSITLIEDLTMVALAALSLILT